MSQNGCRYWLGFILMIGITGCQGEIKNATTTVAAAARSPHPGTRTNPVDGAEMVFIPPGEFLMGSDADEIEQIWKKFKWNETEKSFTSGEQPAHRVRVSGFWMYRNNVTVAQYRKFCAATGHPLPPVPPFGWTATHPM